MPANYEYKPVDVQATQVTAADQYAPDQAQAAQGTAVTSEVKPFETVQGQMTGLLDSDSDYMKRAEAKGASFANSRGLLNTSMGAGAAQASAIDAALPIASQDANIYSQQRSQNQTEQNAMNQLNTQLKNATNLANTGHMNEARKAFMDAQNQANQMNAQLGTQVNLANSEWANRFGMSGLEQQQRLEQMSESQRYNLETLARQQGYNLETMTVQQLNDLQKVAVEQQNVLQRMATDQGYTLEQFNQKFGQDTAMALLNQNQIIQRMGLEQQFNLEVQSQQELHEQKLALDKRLQDQLLQSKELEGSAKLQSERLASAHHLASMEIIASQQEIERAHELGQISDAQKFQYEKTLTGIKEDGAGKRAEMTYNLGIEQLNQEDRDLMHKLIDVATQRYESDMLKIMTDTALNDDPALREKLVTMKENNYYGLLEASAALTGLDISFADWGAFDEATQPSINSWLDFYN